MRTRPVLHPVVDGTKQCSLCDQKKPVEDFGRRAGKGSHYSRCRTCRSALALFKKYQDRFGISEGEYLTILHNQQGKCAICKQVPKPASDGRQTLHLDHNHETGLARGLLCTRCNWALGVYERIMTPEWLKSLQRYLS